MDVKTLVEGYCQVTGRPAFTITVDEYLKFAQSTLLETSVPFSKQVVVQEVQKEEKKEKEEEEQKQKEENFETPKDFETPKEEQMPKPIPSKEQVPLKEEPFRPTEKKTVEAKPVERKPETEKKSMALAMLKSVKG